MPPEGTVEGICRDCGARIWWACRADGRRVSLAPGARTEEVGTTYLDSGDRAVTLGLAARRRIARSRAATGLPVDWFVLHRDVCPERKRRLALDRRTRENMALLGAEARRTGLAEIEKYLGAAGEGEGTGHGRLR